MVEESRGVPTGGLSMFEISTRPWLYNLTLKYGYQITTLSAIPKQEFQAIANLGFDMVWMMGIWELGEYGLNYDQTNSGYAQNLPGYTTADIIGSPYAVVNYTCNPQLGTDADIAAMRRTLNGMGLLLMLDYVPNHTAVDCPWATNETDNYVKVNKGTNPPYDSSRYLPNGIAYGWAGWGDSWQDTAQINIWNPKTRKLRTNEVMHVASLADAIRCDMAFLLLNSQFQQIWGAEVGTWGYTQPATEWWADTITAVKAQYPKVIFLAEVYSPNEPALQSLGFDYTYDKTLHDKLGGGNLDDVRGWITGNSASFATHSAHFTSNHDEQRGATFFGSWWRSDAAALLTYTLPGMRFFWMGDFNGYQHQLMVQLRREESEPTVADCYSFYQTFLSIINTPVFKQGQWQYMDVIGDNTPLIAFHWSLGNERRLCVINFSAEQQGWGTIVLPDAQAQNGNDTIPVTDLLSGAVYYRSASALRTSGLNVGVNSWYGSIFEY